MAQTNGAVLKWIVSPVSKHGDHDQSSHGSWSTGAELSDWNPTGSVPESPRNAGGMTPKAWEAWEHGPDGQNFIALFRKYACQELGLEVPETPFDQGGYLNYMMDRGWGKPSRDEAKGMLKAIANGRPQPALYRGMTDSSEPQDQASLDALLSTKPGDTFDMPLVSTSRSLGVATWYAADTAGTGKNSVVMKIQEGAKGVALKKENSTYPQDHEVITSGKFEVVAINKVSTPYWSRSIFEPRFTPGNAEYPDTYQIATYDKTRFTPEQAKTAWEAVSRGDYKSLETPTFKLTQDRSGGGLSSWTKQEGKEFTVIEVKMVEPHTVQKAKNYGNDFFNLFNNMPFIHDEAKDVAKHGDHDQSSHGSWATGGASGVSDSELERAHEGFEFSEESSLSALYSYTHNGYKLINEYQRSGDTYELIMSEKDEFLDKIPGVLIDAAEIDTDDARGDDADLAVKTVEKLIERTTEALDLAIDEAPQVLKDKLVFRVVSVDALRNLKEGDVFSEKGFVSTTQSDLRTDSKLRENLGNIDKTTDDAVAIIYNGNFGKGLAVNYNQEAAANKNAFEREIILPRNTEFKFIGKDKDGNYLLERQN